jgi:hypothetical protein
MQACKVVDVHRGEVDGMHVVIIRHPVAIGYPRSAAELHRSRNKKP